jgi:hypothetical protein
MRAAILFLLLATSASAAPGTLLFNQAYKLEETDPAGSIDVYRSALAAGLPADLARAAYWRMFFIFKDQENYGMALQTSASLPPSARAQIVESIQERYALTRQTLDDYVRALTALVSRDPEKKKNAADALARLHSKSGPAMQKRILQDLAENQMEELALTLIPESSTDPDSVLRKCDLLVFLGRHAEASKLIQGIYASDDFTTSQKYRAVYLLGRSRRDTEDEAILYRTAERYAQGDDRIRMRALAAYSLLRQGYAEQGLDLLRGHRLPADPDIQLLSLVLRAEVERDTSALRELRSKRDSLKSIVRKRKDAHLAQRALRVPGVLE